MSKFESSFDKSKFFEGKNLEQHKQDPFFGLTEGVIQEAYKDKKKSGEYDVYKLRKDLTKKFDNYLQENDNEIPNDFFENIIRVTNDYISLKIDNYKEVRSRSDAALKYCVLDMLIRHPKFVKEPRCIKVIELLSANKCYEPGNYDMYCDYSDDESKYVHRGGFGIENLKTFEQIVDNENIWQSKNKNFSEPLLSSIAQATASLSEKYPSETLAFRLKLLKQLSKHNIPSVEHYLVYTFETQEDKETLKTIINKDPRSAEYYLARSILDGGFDNTVWM